ncbi:unnamed protein product [Somion occarium]|uniref:Uncharacterized protein n=1 Tax=Somion occarium TaxID=3059160 RepID=A0ABP1DZ25_9APHY
MSVTTNVDRAKLSSNIFLGGLALQVLSFAFFTLLFFRFLYHVYTLEPQVWSRDSLKPWYQDWRGLAGAMFISCIGILIRSAYRTIELSEGYSGRLATTEGFFYGLDTLPLFFAVAVYVPFWPGRFIPDTKELRRIEFQERNDKEMNRIGMLSREARGSRVELT